MYRGRHSYGRGRPRDREREWNQNPSRPQHHGSRGYERGWSRAPSRSQYHDSRGHERGWSQGPSRSQCHDSRGHERGWSQGPSRPQCHDSRGHERGWSQGPSRSQCHDSRRHERGWSQGPSRSQYHDSRGHERRWSQGPSRSQYREYGNFYGGAQRFKDGIPSISCRFLENMVNDESLSGEDITIRLSTNQSGFTQLLSQNMGDGIMVMLLKLFEKICQGDEVNNAISQVLQEVLKHKFMEKLIPFLYGLISEEKKEQAGIYLANAMLLLQAFLLHLPKSSLKQVSMLLLIIEEVVNRLNLHDTNDLGLHLEEVKQMKNEVEEQMKSSQTYKTKESLAQKIIKKNFNEMHDKRPPNDFRQISIFPQPEEVITSADPFVRTNLVSSAYHDQDHYLDVQFRLLREDFVRPLREGIQYYRSEVSSAHSRKEVAQHVKVYEKVAIEYPRPGRTGVVYCIQFDPTPFAGVRWQNSKRLMFGNLVCLSHDTFQNHLLFGTIADREAEDLNDGYLTLEIVYSCGQEQVPNLARLRIRENNELDEDSDEHESKELADELPEYTALPKIDFEKTYTMVESDAYFEAYRHVLVSLQGTTKIPLERYIVQCNSDIHPPAYLQEHTSSYDFSPILPGRVVNILRNCVWPTAEEMQLDESQLKAVKNALTSELSVIQGPPGTGKTHIGLVIMKLLLANRQKPEKSPILVVCYTNHALDQFLEGISEFQPTGIVRVGGRCKNEALQMYTLSHLRKSTSSSKTFNKKTLCQLKDELLEIELHMKKSTDILDVSRNMVLRLSILQTVIPPELYEQFGQYYDKNENVSLLKWLGLLNEETKELSETFVCAETLQALVVPLLNMRINHQMVLHAMAVTGHFKGNALLAWLNNNRCKSFHREPEAKMVYKFLDGMPLPFDEWHLLQQGMSKVDISCAYLVTRSTDLQVLYEWIIIKAAHGGYSENKSSMTEPDCNEVGFEEEGKYIQERRMLDEDFNFQRDNHKYHEHEEQRRKQLIANISAETFLQSDEPHQKAQDDWKTISRRKKSQKNMLRFKKVDAMLSREARQVTNIYYLASEKRWKLYKRWVKDCQAKLREAVDQHHMKYNQLAKSVQQLERIKDRDVLKQADVIGITTTGAAKYRDIIHKLSVRIVVVEEAAEVLEAHVVTSMPESTQHLILIGDHQQLKPSPTVYELARKYNLDVSLFERMINNGTPYESLSTQHRMRPCIADLLRLDIYGHLQDHSSVREYEDITGVEKNVFFLSHNHLEDHVSDGRSKANQHEAKFVVALCQYLLLQGYAPEKITILTAYTGQLLAIKNAMKENLRYGVRVTAVDNFQGEENDIILLSLVRSNEEGKVGFLSVKNRICVALSRAKRGLFCIGNFELLQKIPLWTNIVEYLKEGGMFGNSLPLQCKNHPEHITQVQTAADFSKVPEGGCGTKCEYRLPCGHVCSRLCHPDDEKHEQFKCRKPCPKLCEKGHRCHRKCFEDCGPCFTSVLKYIPQCLHKQKMRCGKDPSTAVCQTPCTKMLVCGHQCTDVCGRPCITDCQEKVPVTLPCGHLNQLPCHSSNKPLVSSCKEKCEEVLDCGHLCKGTCGSCFQGRLHQKCGQKCTGSLICGHQCEEPCSRNCPPCNQKCRTYCEHSKCKKRCCEPCVPCKEKCQWKCKHYQCTKLCSEPCDRPPCNRPCEKKLKCRHACIGLCGEPCPKLCRICDKKKVEQTVSGDGNAEDARFVKLEDCGHIFTYQGLDKWMNPDENDDENSGGQDNIDIKLRECPRCKTPVRRSRRYGQIVNEQLRMINEVKEKLAGKTSVIALTCRHLFMKMSRALITSYFPSEYKILQSGHPSSFTELNVLEVRYQSLERISKMLENLKRRRRTSDRSDFDSDVNNLRKWLMQPRANFSDQETNDLECELQRLEQAALLVEAQHQSQTTRTDSRTKTCLEELHHLLFDDFAPYRGNKKNKVENNMEHVNFLISDLGIFDEEKDMTVKTINLRKGHWYKCKNGHVYCIGECGGATQESVCPECNKTIGKTGHRLRLDNQAANEAEEATRSTFGARGGERVRWRERTRKQRFKDWGY